MRKKELAKFIDHTTLGPTISMEKARKQRSMDLLPYA
jgi:hypothetical protein